MHLHSVLWFALLVYLVARLYTSVAGQTTLRGVATYLFAVSALHGTTVGWIASRNSLIAACLGVTALLFYDAWRKRGAAGYLLAALVVFVAALLGAEAAAATLAYLAAYALFIDTGSLQSRVLRTLPFGVLFIIYRLAYDALGFGAYASGLYLDPGSEPVAFLRGFIDRAPILLLAQITGMATSLSIFAKGADLRALWLTAMIVVSAFVLLFRGQLLEGRPARFFLTGALLSLLPVGAAGTDERTLIFVSIGGYGLLAVLLCRHLFAPPEVPAERSWAKKGGSYGLALLHVYVAPLLFLVNINGLARFTQLFTDQATRLPADAAAEGKTLVLINSPAPQLTMSFASIRALNGLPLPAASYSLASGNTNLKVTRQADRLLIEAQDGFVLDYDVLFRGDRIPFKVGDTVKLKHMTAVVERLTQDGRPEAVAFEFANGLDDPCLAFLIWENNGYQRFVPPAEGQTAALERQDPIKIAWAGASKAQAQPAPVVDQAEAANAPQCKRSGS